MWTFRELRRVKDDFESPGFVREEEKFWSIYPRMCGADEELVKKRFRSNGVFFWTGEI